MNDITSQSRDLSCEGADIMAIAFYVKRDLVGEYSKTMAIAFYVKRDLVPRRSPVFQSHVVSFSLYRSLFQRLKPMLLSYRFLTSSM